uniref:Disease resistance protein n=1 Tax=Davidia involucrata TaxID=16924 RepID=A0A5B6Z279_DAVIN
MPEGLKKLTSLQVLKGFVIGHPGKNPCKLGDVAYFKKLRKLSMHIASEASVAEGELQKLKEIENLSILTMSWGEVTLPGEKLSSNVGGGGGASSSSRKEDVQLTLTMKRLSFPPNLEKLDLRCFPHRMLPEQLRPSNLEKLKQLYIRGGPLESLVFSEQNNKKWEVEILLLKYLNNLKIGGSKLQEDFPHLIYFEKVRCNYEKNVEWNKEADEGWDALTSQLLNK